MVSWYGIKSVALPLKLKILSSKNRFGKFWNFDPWRPQFWPEPKKWPKWFRNDFSRAFERRFPFCSTMRRSRNRRGGGGVFKHPPPPSRSWKIQRPIRTRVNLRSNFDLDLSRSCYIWFDASWRGKHDGFKIIALSFQTQEVIIEELFRSKMPFLIFRDLWRLSGWS